MACSLTKGRPNRDDHHFLRTDLNQLCNDCAVLCKQIMLMLPAPLILSCHRALPLLRSARRCSGSIRFNSAQTGSQQPLLSLIFRAGVKSLNRQNYIRDNFATAPAINGNMGYTFKFSGRFCIRLRHAGLKPILPLVCCTKKTERYFRLHLLIAPWFSAPMLKTS